MFKIIKINTTGFHLHLSSHLRASPRYLKLCTSSFRFDRGITQRHLDYRR